MNVTEARDIVENVQLTFDPDLSILVQYDQTDTGVGGMTAPTGGFVLQIRHPKIGSGRKWRLSAWMTKSEVVQTAFMAYLAWMEHEVRESFKYKGEAIFSPHYDVDALVKLSAAGKFDVR
jgi:hypothetical protein